MQELLNVVGQEGPEHLKQLLLFVQYASKLKNENLLAQPSAQDTQTAPLNLPDSVESFLAAMCNMCPEEVPGCWSAVRKLVWNMEMLNDKAVSIAFQQNGMDFGFRELTHFIYKLDQQHLASAHSLFPPSHTCNNPDCTHSLRG